MLYKLPKQGHPVWVISVHVAQNSEILGSIIFEHSAVFLKVDPIPLNHYLQKGKGVHP
jgi:hypothetical protein